MRALQLEGNDIQPQQPRSRLTSRRHLGSSNPSINRIVLAILFMLFIYIGAALNNTKTTEHDATTTTLRKSIKFGSKADKDLQKDVSLKYDDHPVPITNVGTHKSPDRDASSSSNATTGDIVLPNILLIGAQKGNVHLFKFRSHSFHFLISNIMFLRQRKAGTTSVSYFIFYPFTSLI